MYRSFNILFLLLISFYTVAQQDNNQSMPAATQQADSVNLNTTSSKKTFEGLDTPEKFLKKAADFYSQGRFKAAAELYEQVLAKYGTSEKLYYNLGNAYYKSNELAPAILNYERALRLNPVDRDARFNLEMCQGRIDDKINPIGGFIINRWFKSVRNTFVSNAWGVISIVFFLLFIACLFAYFFARVSWLKKTGFFAGILFIGVSVLSLIYSGEQRNSIVHPDKAILFTPTVTVKSSPDISGTDLFILHEGSKVTILSILGSWSEIELEDGNIGWLESNNLQMI